MRPRKMSWADQNVVIFTRFGPSSLVLNWRYKFEEFWKDHPRFGGGIVISVALILLCLGCYFFSLTAAQPGSPQLQVVEIKFGAPLREIGRMLENEGLIRNRFAFETYIRLNPRNRMVKAGRYRIGPGMSIPSIIKILRTGIPEQVRVTIPEGLTNQEIATLLATKGLVNRDRFLQALKHPELMRNELPEFDTDNPEGFLFPDTYEFRLNSSEDEIATTMLRRFKEIFERDFKDVPRSHVKQLVIMASLIEKEAQKPEERPVIAGVFYNRLRQNYQLQSCATVQYVLGARKPQLSVEDTRIESPYNTYLHYGLPPGPIANPGLASLQAAVHPDNVTYLYFVAKPDGHHIFSNTFAEHLAAQRRVENN